MHIGKIKMSFDVWITDGATLTAIEFKLLNKVIDWRKVSVVRPDDDGATGKATLSRVLDELHRGFRAPDPAHPPPFA